MASVGASPVQLATMKQLLKLYIDLCLFQAKPQDLPYSQGLVLVTGTLAVFTYTLTDTLNERFGMTLLVSLVQVLLFGFIIWLVLRLRKRAERWMQTIAALYGTGSLLQLIGWPISSWFERVKESPEAASTPLLLVVVLGFWFLAIMTSVLRHAMEVSLGFGLMVSIACQAITVIALVWLFGLGHPAP